MIKVNDVVKASPPEELPQRLRVTLAEIAEVKRNHIERCLLYSPDEAGHILGKSVRTVLDLVKDGKLIAADENIKSGRNGLKGSQGLRITAESLAGYRQSIIVPAKRWAE